MCILLVSTTKEDQHCRIGGTQVVGWRLFKTDAGLKLQCDWNLKDSDAVTELSKRVGVVADAENHHPELQTLENNKVQAEIWTQSIGDTL